MGEDLGIPNEANRDLDRRKRLLERLDADSETAWQKYAQLMRRLDRFFEFRRCSEPDRMTLETLRRVEAKLVLEDIRDVEGYAVGVAKNVAREFMRNTRLEVSVEHIPGGLERVLDPSDEESAIIDKIDKRVVIAFLRECLKHIEEPSRSLVLAYYQAPEGLRIVHRRQLAKKAGMTAGALMTHMNRVRSRLKDCLTGRLRRDPLTVR